jgi:hypothetical protein
MRKQILLLVLITFFLLTAPVFSHNMEKITTKQQNAILLMVAHEFPDLDKLNNSDVSDRILNYLNTENKQTGMSMACSSDRLTGKETCQCFVNLLGDKISLDRLSVVEGEEKHSRVYRYKIKSDFKFITLENIDISAVYIHNKGRLVGKVTETTTDFTTLSPGESGIIEVAVLFPQNWRLKTSETKGRLDVRVAGNMSVSRKNDSHDDPEILSYPFNPVVSEEAIVLNIAPEKLLYLLIGLIILGIIFIPSAFGYQLLAPIAVTLKMGDKIRSYNIAKGEKISIGGVMADFEIPGADRTFAEIQRRFRRFVLVEKVTGTLPEKRTGRKGCRISIKLGQNFSLSINGINREFEFLPGNREQDDESHKVPDDFEVDEET